MQGVAWRIRLALVLLVAAAVVGACSSASNAAGADPMNPCFDDVVLVDMNQLTCARAIELANQRLGWLHWPISSIDYMANLCPPGARCRLIARFDHAWITFHFWIGDPVMVHVGPTDVRGVFVADAPEPPPDWLVDEPEILASGT